MVFRAAFFLCILVLGGLGAAGWAQTSPPTVPRIVIKSIPYSSTKVKGDTPKLLPLPMTPLPQRNVKIIVYSARPMENALTILQEQFGCPITSEDPPFDASRSMIRIYPTAYPVPAWHLLQFKYSLISKSDRLSVLRDLTKTYEHSDPNVVFHAAPSAVSDAIYHVYPIEFVDSRGRLRPFRSLLSQPVTILPDDDGDSVAFQICDALTKNNPHHSVDYLLMNKVITPKTGVNELHITQIARTLLDKILVDTTRNAPYLEQPETYFRSWSLSCEPSIVARTAPSECSLWMDWSQTFGQDYSDTTTILVASLRPLADTLSLISPGSANVCPAKVMIYEDAPWSNGEDILRDRKGVVWTPRGDTLTYRFADALPLRERINGLVAAYNEHTTPSKFAVQEAPDSFFIYPTVTKNAEDKPVVLSPVLNTSVTLPAGSALPSTLLRQLCSALSAKTGKRIIAGRLPRGLDGAPVNFAVENQSAVSCLTRLSRLLPKPVFWRLIYDPHEKQYVLTAVSSLGDVFRTTPQIQYK